MARNTGFDLLVNLKQTTRLFVVVCCMCGASVVEADVLLPVDQANDRVQQYLQFRDALREKFNNIAAGSPVPREAELAEVRRLKILIPQLKAIIGPVHIDGFEESEYISISLIGAPFGDTRLLDGVIYHGKHGELFVTTKALARHWLNDWYRDETHRIRELAHFENHFFSFDAAVMPFMTLPIKDSGKDVYIHTTLALKAQDSGSVPPDVVYVFVEKGRHVLMLEYRPTIEITDIPACATTYSTVIKQTDSSSDAFLAYQRCFSVQAKFMPFYRPLMHEVQSIADKIMRM